MGGYINFSGVSSTSSVVLSNWGNSAILGVVLSWIDSS